MTRKIALGKHSGKASIKHKLEQLGLSATPESMELIRQEVSRAGEVKKRNITDAEFIEIFDAIARSKVRSARKVAAVEANLLSGISGR